MVVGLHSRVFIPSFMDLPCQKEVLEPMNIDGIKMRIVCFTGQQAAYWG